MLSGKRGFTLIEVMIVLLILALIMPAIGLAFFQLLKVPPQETDELTVINEVSLALGWINNDGMMAQSFSSAPPYDANDPEHLYGGFYWVDRTSGNVSHCYATRYYYDDGHLVRREWKDNELISTIIIARHIADYDDMQFAFHPHGDWPAGNFSRLGLPYVVITTKATEGQGNWFQSAEGTHYVYLRGGQALSHGFAVLAKGRAGDAIDISGDDLIIDGDIRSYSGISIIDSGHSVTGWAQAVGDIDDDAGAILDDREEPYYPLKSISWNLELEDFIPKDILDDSGNKTLAPDVGPYFLFDDAGEVDLGIKSVDDYSRPIVWSNNTLRSGIYYNKGGTIMISTHNASGMVTLIGDKVKVTADNTEFTPFCNGVLLYATGVEKEVEFSGEGGNWYGTLFAPDGLVKMTGSGLNLYGAVAARTFTHTNTQEGVLIQF